MLVKASTGRKSPQMLSDILPVINTDVIVVNKLSINMIQISADHLDICALY